MAAARSSPSIIQLRIHHLQRTGKLIPLKGRNFRPLFGRTFPQGWGKVTARLGSGHGKVLAASRLGRLEPVVAGIAPSSGRLLLLDNFRLLLATHCGGYLCGNLVGGGVQFGASQHQSGLIGRRNFPHYRSATSRSGCAGTAWRFGAPPENEPRVP